MKKKLPLIVTFLFMAGISLAIWRSNSIRRDIDESNMRMQAAAGLENQGAEDSSGGGIAGMSVLGLEIVQGEKGHEIWHLVAENAVMSEQGGDIIAQKPYLTYYLNNKSDKLGPGDLATPDVLNVSSETGDVNQQENRLRFAGNVVATHKGDVLRTSQIDYDGGQNRLHCPEESQIEGKGIRGKTREMFWHLDDNTLHARGGVSLNFETGRMIFPGGAK